MTDGPYLLGIDFGTGGARVGIFDPEGTPLVFSEREYTLLPSTASRRRGCILAEVLAGEVPEGLREQVSWSAIAGPSIAGEVAVGRDTCVVFTGRDAGVLEEMAGLFRTPY